MKTVPVISQDSAATVVKCPICKKSITLLHEQHEEPTFNDGIGRLDLGEQNFSYVVCPHDKCTYAGKMLAKQMK